MAVNLNQAITDPECAKAFAHEGLKRIEQACKLKEVQPFLQRFRSPRGYETWDHHIAMAWIIALGVKMNPEILRSATGDRVGAAAMSALIAYTAIRRDAPPRYLGRQLAEAFLHTDLPRLTFTPKLALPCYRLFLPKGLLKNEFGIPINVVTVVDRGLISKFFEEAAGVISPPEPGLCLLTHTISGESYYCDFKWSDPEDALRDTFETDTPKAVKEVMRKMTLLAVQATMTMAVMPELVVIEDSLTVTAGRGFARSAGKPEPSPPTWIGREFRTRIIQPIVREGAPVPSTGLQVRPHWRQGHWRAVACGPKWKDHKLTWIKPTFVGRHSLDVSGSSVLPNCRRPVSRGKDPRRQP